MENKNSFIIHKIRLRKICMIIFSFCTILLISGICSWAMESGSRADEIIAGTQNFANVEKELKKADNTVKNPREMIMDKRDKKIRMYCAFALFFLMAGSFVVDIIFVRCPICSGHICYGINPSFCHHCGSSFTCKETMK